MALGLILSAAEGGAASWTTVEVRWFVRGKAPACLMTWFADDDPATDIQSPRVDHYLRLPEIDGLGIKIREGRLEIKRRYASESAVLTPRVAGLVELWRKWGAGPVDDDSSFASDVAWVAVEKTRRLRTYRVAPDGTVAPSGRSVTPSGECSVELTEAVVDGQRWWTLGFEALGEEAALRRTLDAVARHVLGEMPETTLALDASYGYPRWLQLVAG